MSESQQTHLRNLESALELAGIGYFFSDLSKGVYVASAVVKRLFKLPDDREPTRADVLSAMHPDDRERLQQTLVDIERNPRDYEIDYRIRGRGDSWVPVRISATTTRDADGRIQGFGVIQDLSTSVRASFHARLNERRLHDFAAADSNWFWETNQDHRIIYLSRRFETITGLPTELLLGTSRIDLSLQTEGAYGWSRHLTDLEARRPFQDFTFWRHVSLHDSKRLICVSGVPVFDEEGDFQGYRGVGRDITEDYLDRQRLQFLANHDKLTGLLNRHAFETKARTMAIGSQEPTRYLVLLDLDRFKYVNDNFGHARGDLLLIAVAERLSNWLPPACHIARLSGDEFAVQMIDIDCQEQMFALLSAILEKLAEPYLLDGVNIHIRASAGFTKQHKTQIDRALLEADVALYAAKKKGGGHVEYFDEGKKRAAARRKSLERELREALREEEFSLVFQPQIDLATGRLAGAETLLRWRVGTNHEVSPMEFIPLAEEIGLMPDIGRWVLRHAIRHQKLWTERGLQDLVVAVNVSATQFVHDDIAAMLEGFLNEFQVQAQNVELEITESVFLQDQETVAEAMRQVRHLGASMALDDFGTGYSSLSYLRNFPINRLKIDRSFIQPIIDAPSASAIVDGIVRLAHSLDLEVVAEGVELDQHVQILKRMGCAFAQGYHYSKPLLSDQFEQFARQTMGKTLENIHS